MHSSPTVLGSSDGRDTVPRYLLAEANTSLTLPVFLCLWQTRQHPPHSANLTTITLPRPLACTARRLPAAGMRGTKSTSVLITPYSVLRPSRRAFRPSSRFGLSRLHSPRPSPLILPNQANPFLSRHSRQKMTAVSGGYCCSHRVKGSDPVDATQSPPSISAPSTADPTSCRPYLHLAR